MLHHISPFKAILMRNSSTRRSRKRIIKAFSKRFGFVYFGNVDQNQDDQHIVRGLTVSSYHQDYSYTVGSFDGYDINIVDRLDTLQSAYKQYKTHNWLIFEINLHNGIDLPRIFVGAHDQTNSAYTKLFTAFPMLQPVPLGTFEEHSREFTGRYNIYTSPTHFIDAERYFSAEMTRTIAAHFWPLSVEIFEGSLYVYADNKTITINLLETMLNNGVWLARKIDEQAKG